MLVVRQNALNSRRRHENKGLGHGVIYSLYSHELSCSVRDQTVIFTMAISEGENAHVALLFYGTCAGHMKAAACVPVKVLNAHSFEDMCIVLKYTHTPTGVSNEPK